MVWKIKHPFGARPIFTDELLGNGDESHGDESESWKNHMENSTQNPPVITALPSWRDSAVRAPPVFFEMF